VEIYRHNNTEVEMFVSVVRMSELAALKTVMPKSIIIDSCPVDYWTVYADCGIQVSKLTPIQNKCFTFVTMCNKL